MTDERIKEMFLAHYNKETWQAVGAYYLVGAKSAEAEVRKEQAEKIATLERELTKAQDELNCAEVQCEAFLCAINAPELVGSDGFDCMGDFVLAIQTEALRQLSEARKAMKSVKNNLEHQRRFGTDTFGVWRNAAVAAEGDLEEFLIKAKEQPNG